MRQPKKVKLRADSESLIWWLSKLMVQCALCSLSLIAQSPCFLPATLFSHILLLNSKYPTQMAADVTLLMLNSTQTKVELRAENENQRFTEDENRRFFLLTRDKRCQIAVLM